MVDPVDSTAGLYEYVESLPTGTPVRYRLRRNDQETEVVVRSQRFGLRDWIFLFGPYLLNGVTYTATAIVVWVLRPGALGEAFVALGATWALFLLTAMDLYGPAPSSGSTSSGETLVPPAMLQLALLFPHPHKLGPLAVPGLRTLAGRPGGLPVVPVPAGGLLGADPSQHGVARVGFARARRAAGLRVWAQSISARTPARPVGHLGGALRRCLPRGVGAVLGDLQRPTVRSTWERGRPCCFRSPSPTPSSSTISSRSMPW